MTDTPLMPCLTPDEICEELVQNCADPLGAACHKIAAMAQANHKLFGCNAQLVETNRILISMVDELSFELPFSTVDNCRARIDHIRKYLEAGSRP